MHLHKFSIQGKEYGISYPGGIFFKDDPKSVYLKDFQFRDKECFLYEYNFFDGWEHKIRMNLSH